MAVSAIGKFREEYLKKKEEGSLKIEFSTPQTNKTKTTTPKSTPSNKRLLRETQGKTIEEGRAIVDQARIKRQEPDLPMGFNVQVSPLTDQQFKGGKPRSVKLTKQQFTKEKVMSKIPTSGAESAANKFDLTYNKPQKYDNRGTFSAAPDQRGLKGLAIGAEKLDYKYFDSPTLQIGPQVAIGIGEGVKSFVKSPVKIGAAAITGGVVAVTTKNPGIASAAFTSTATALGAYSAIKTIGESRGTGRLAEVTGNVIGEYGAFTAVAIGSGFLASKSPLQLETVQLPKGEGEFTTVYKGLTWKGKPLGKYDLGNINVNLEGYTPTTKSETFFSRKIAGETFPETELAKFDKGLKSLGETYNVKSKFKNNFPEVTKTLPKEGVDVVKTFAKKEGALAYGSFTAEAQLPKGALARGRGAAGEVTVGDIDLQLKAGEWSTQLKANELLGSLRKAGITNARISRENPTLIQTNVGGQWRNAVDVHSWGQPLDGTANTEGALGYRFNQGSIRVEGIKTMRLSEFGVRKGASIFTFRDMGFSPEPHRLKDIPDFITSQRYLLQSARAKPSAFENLNSLESIYRSEGFVTTSSSVKVPIADYSPSFSISSTSPSIGFSFPKQTNTYLRSSPSISSNKNPSISLSTSRSSYISTPSILGSIGSLGSTSSSKSSPSISLRLISPGLNSKIRSPSPSISKYISFNSISPGIRSQITSISPSISPSINISTGIGWSPSSVPLPPVGGFALGGGISKRRRKSKTGQKKKYRPDLASSLFNIRGSMPTGNIAPFQSRPIVSRRKKRSKK